MFVGVPGRSARCENLPLYLAGYWAPVRHLALRFPRPWIMAQNQLLCPSQDLSTVGRLRHTCGLRRRLLGKSRVTIRGTVCRDLLLPSGPWESRHTVPLPHSGVHVGRDLHAGAECEGHAMGPKRGSRPLPRLALVPTGGIGSPCRRRPPGSQAHRASDYTASCQLRPKVRGRAQRLLHAFPDRCQNQELGIAPGRS